MNECKHCGLLHGLRPGDIVRLKSGNFAITVGRIINGFGGVDPADEAECYWFDSEGHIQERGIVECALVRVKDEELDK